MKTLLIPIFLFLGISMNLFANEKSHNKITTDMYNFRFPFGHAIESYSKVIALKIGGVELNKVSRNVQDALVNPESLGNKINTERDEIFPIFGGGGLKIFMCSFDGFGFGIVKNLGSPLSQQYIDYKVITNNKHSNGYFSSIRTGSGGGTHINSFEAMKDSEKEIPDVQFYVNAPKSIPAELRVRETFPLRNYVFFDLGSTEIPTRYVLIAKDKAKDFKEDQLEAFAPIKFSGRSNRQMNAYYNVINILGHRMQKSPQSTIKLVGSSEKGSKDGLDMAISVKKYLVNIFGITSWRIAVEGRNKPKLPSEQQGDKLELDLLRQCDRRVSIESSSPALLMEFQSGKNASLKPIIINPIQSPASDSLVSFYIIDADKILSSWSLQITDENGMIQSFGPYTQDKVNISGKAILGTRTEGKYKAALIGKTINGTTITKDTIVNITLWTPTKQEEGMRFSVIYEFNDSKAIAIYKKYLTEVVTPKIPIGGTVIIRGYTDIIGDATNNQKLSFARASDVKTIFEKALLKSGRKDVKFEVSGFGEDQNLTPFENKFPEERFYNRTVVIDIVSTK
ncbi:MAG: hypothetical protein WCP69_12345 [Bacteroidota bacterium]